MPSSLAYTVSITISVTSRQRHPVRQLVDVATRVARKGGRQPGTCGPDSVQDPSREVAAPELGLHLGRDVAPEAGRDLLVDADVAQHREAAPPRRHEDENAVAVLRPLH